MVVPPESLCGCGSGRAFGQCHLKDGNVVMSAKLVEPRPPLTGIKNRKCRLSPAADCCEKISGDHIISEAVLKEISAQKIVLRSSNFTRTVGVKSDAIKTKWLCRRHNSALHLLDDEAARLFRALQDSEIALASGAPAPIRFYLFHGEDIERWMLKTMLAAYFGRLTNIVPGKFELPEHALQLFSSYLPQPYGLHVHIQPRPGESVRATNISRNASLALLTEGQTLVGIDFSLGGLELRYLLAGSELAVASNTTSLTWRPNCVCLYEAQEVYAIAFVWSEGSQNTIWLSRGSATAPLPSNVPEHSEKP